MSTQDHTEFERRMKAALLESSDALDGRTRSALTRMRHAAIEAGEQRRGVFTQWLASSSAVKRGWAPAGALAMALLVTFFFAQQRDVDGGLGGSGVVTALVNPSNSLDDLDLVSDAEAYELSADEDFELDSDFYEWAAAKAGMLDNGRT
jgi:hypothetical protein